MRELRTHTEGVARSLGPSIQSCKLWEWRAVGKATGCDEELLSELGLGLHFS